MAYKVNYGLERAERNRAKQAKKEAKLRDRKANSAGNDSATDVLATDEAAESTDEAAESIVTISPADPE